MCAYAHSSGMYQVAVSFLVLLAKPIPICYRTKSAAVADIKI